MFFAPYERLAKTIKDGNWLRGKFADMNNENIVSALFNCCCKFVNYMHFHLIILDSVTLPF
jgi:hypothetical protein